MLPLLCLAGPSWWLLASVPPLWRDIDAYVQVTSPPNETTILLHAPLYCELAQVPLWIGERASGGSMRFRAFMKHPRLTDTGIYLLLALQHAGFCVAAFYLISALSASLGVRILLAVFLASHSLFYAFAHCVGAESLGMILILLLAGTGLRMVGSYPAPKVHCWLLAGLILFCCVLTRHINGILAGLLPLSFLFAAIVLSSPFFAKPAPALARSREHLRAFGGSIVLGIVALLLASGYVRLVCQKARIEPRSEFGFTFLWRLDFLPSTPPLARQNLFQEISRRVTLPESRRLVRLLQDWTDHHRSWDPVQFVALARADFEGGDSKVARQHFDRILNDVATAFLFPPIGQLVESARDDFVQSTLFSEGEIARYLFLTTDYINTHRLQMPQASGLITFRCPADAVMKFQNAVYFRLWDFLSFRAWCVLWLLAAALLIWLRKRERAFTLAIVAYGVALALLGMLITLATCFFALLLPRFAFPMMELLLLSLTVILGFLLPGQRPISRRDPCFFSRSPFDQRP